MKHILLLLAMALISFNTFAQARDKEDRKEERDERKAANSDRVDIVVFRRQILTLPEFSDQRKKLAELKKQGHGIGKIYAVVDSLTDVEDGKFLKGYIELILGDNSANVYELTFDRKLKSIILVKPTGEQLEIEKAEKPEPAARKTAHAKPVPKKKKSEDDEEDEDEDEDEEKPVKGKQKDDDD
jgi:hypothetical protein